MAKEKDPAFLFYSKDWVDGTAEMLPEEKGVYIDLLVHHHQHEGLPTDLKKMARIVRMSEKDFLVIWKEISHKFFEENGRFFNQKMLIVMGKRKEKSIKNTVIGTFASILRLKSLKTKEYELIKKSFNCDDWLNEPTERLTERLTEWIDERLKSIETANANEDILLTIELREEKFKNDVLQFFEYDSNMLNKFIRYWTEKNSSGKKMKFELEKTFEISKRLLTWKNNDEKFNKQTLKTNENGKQLSKQELEQQEFNRRYGTTFGQ